MTALKTRFLRLLALVTLWSGMTSALAEDIDIFVTGQAANTATPAVLVILDNTANWNTAFTNEINALVTAVNAIGNGKVRLGLMMFTETGSGNTGQDGGYVRAAIRSLDSTYKTQFVNMVSALHVNEDKSNGGKAGLAMWEAFRYLSGRSPYAGNAKNKADFTGNTFTYSVNTQGKGGSVDISAASRAVWALSGNALASKNASTYSAPSLGSCGKTFVIYVSNGPAQDNSNDISTVNTALAAAGGSTTQIPILPSGSADNPADEVARFLSTTATNASGQLLNTAVYTIDVDKSSSGQGPGWTALLRSMANVSGGRYYDVNSQSNAGADISNAFNEIFTEIQAINSAFASVSLPVSVNTQGTYLNQVFIGQFRPDGDARPRWQGNLKQYKLGYVDNVLSLVDAGNANATSGTTGFIASCARSFWTPSIVDQYWATLSPGNQCPEPQGVNYQASNFPDGPIVEKGGQAYVLRAGVDKDGNAVSRNVKTCHPTFASCTSLVDFNSSLDVSPYAASLFLTGSPTKSDRDALINWARGDDTLDEDVDQNLTERRPSIHGDVVHSRPVAVNFGTDSSPQVVVFYGANDGMLRAVNGNRSAAIGAVPAGGEIWSFMPPEFFGRIARLRSNDVLVSFPTITGGQPKPYGFDGPITASKVGNQTVVYAAMRRGGRVLYAFEVSNAVTSVLSSPVLKWKVGCPNLGNDDGCASGFSDMGQTWSAAVPFKAQGYGSGNSPLLALGGGYDSCEDVDASDACTASSKGRRIYILDADTGALLKSFTTDRGVVADVTLVNDADGRALYAYAADLAGNVYRINIGTSAPADWTMTKLASLGCPTTASCTPRRKFFYAPDVVEERGTYYVLLGSGDREKPLTSATLASYPNAASVSNHFFSIKDQPATATWLSSESSNCGSSVICLGSLLSISTSATPTSADLSAKKGWYLALASREQVVSATITVYGSATFSTTQPLVGNSNACQPNLGTARVYNVGYTDASTKNGSANRYQDLPAGGLPPSPVAGKVILDDGTTVPFVIGGSGSSSLTGQAKPPVATGRSQPGKRVYTIIKK